jgi:hypothetical protein
MYNKPCHLHQKIRGLGGLGPATAFAAPCARCTSYIEAIEQGAGDWNALKQRFYAALSRTAELAPLEADYAQRLAIPDLLKDLRERFQHAVAYVEKNSEGPGARQVRRYLATALLELEGENWYEADSTLDDAWRQTVR